MKLPRSESKMAITAEQDLTQDPVGNLFKLFPEII